MGLLDFSLFFPDNYPCSIMWVLRQYPWFRSRLFHSCNGDNLSRIYWGLSKISKGECQKGGIKYKGGGSDPFAHYEYTIGSSLKELRSCILCIISVWFLFCSMRLCSGLHFLLIALEEFLFMFLCLN